MKFLPSIGPLQRHPQIDDWLQSLPVPVPLFDGALLPFILEIDTFNGLAHGEVDEVIRAFLELGAQARLDASASVVENYQFMLGISDIAPLPLDSSSDIWKYVKPSEIYVIRRHRRDRDLYVSIACECEWEEEHGLQLVYRQGNLLVRVSDQDGHLTEADAHDLPEE